MENPFQLNLELIQDEITEILTCSEFQKGELCYRVIHDDSDTKIILIATSRNTELESLQIHRFMHLEVVVGSVSFKNKLHSTNLHAGQKFLTDENSYYLIESIEPSVYLIMAANNFYSINHKLLC